jgi:DNA-binding SARP family transcriptional activator
LFGPFDVRLHGHPLPPPRTQKTHWLLALLALQEGRTLERTWLAGTLWPDSTEEQAARNLRTTLWDLRVSLGPEAHRLEAPTTHTLRLDLVDAEADLLIFDEAIARGDAASLERAVALYRGPLLQGCEEEWILPERAARKQAYLAALETLATAALTRGEPAAAVRHLRRLLAVDPLRESVQRTLMQALEEESRAIGRVLGDRRRVAEALVLLGNTLYAQQEYTAARTHLEEALAIQRALGDGLRAAQALDALANMARRQGDWAAGLRFAEECLALWRATGAQVGVIHALGVLGHLARAMRDFPQAHAAYSESLRLRDQGQHLYLVINGLEDFADLAQDQEHWERAMTLLGAALAQREAAGKPLLPRERADYDAMRARARAALVEEATAAAWSVGRDMTLAQAIAFALAEPSPIAAA